MKNKKFDLRDISIIPTIVSDVNSRSECKPTYSDGFLPLMASPMDTVVCQKNINTYIKNNIIPCFPREDYFDKDLVDRKMVFQSYGLSDIEEQLEEWVTIKRTSENVYWNYDYILIDIANGHMERLINALKKIKLYHPEIKIMVGNVAHPLTYKNLAMAGAHYVRCSIGTGAGCTTAANVAINYPLGSLISECRQIKEEGQFETKIVADGGMQGYDDILKALALGADYVMLGSLLNQCMQSSGSNHLWGIKLPFHVAKSLWRWGFPVKKKYRGMSTKAVQRKWGKVKLTTAEGITKYQKVKYNISTWVENFEDYLKSNMSYCGVTKLEDFIGKVDWVFITENARKRFAK
jgi:hypothetical protein